MIGDRTLHGNQGVLVGGVGATVHGSARGDRPWGPVGTLANEIEALAGLGLALGVEVGAGHSRMGLAVLQSAF